jgi:hypothetical protein
MFATLMEMPVISAFTFSDRLIFLEFLQDHSEGLKFLIEKQNFVSCFDIESGDIKNFFVKRTLWRLPNSFMGLHFALLNLPGFSRSPCVVFDISTEGEAILGAFADRTSQTKTTKWKDRKKFSFLENPGYQFDATDLSNVLNLEYKGVTILKTNINFLFVYEQHAPACLCDFKSIFHFERGEQSFSFVADFSAKFILKLQAIEAACSSVDDVQHLSTSSAVCPISSIAT